MVLPYILVKHASEKDETRRGISFPSILLFALGKHLKVLDVVSYWGTLLPPLLFLSPLLPSSNHDRLTLQSCSCFYAFPIVFLLLCT